MVGDVAPTATGRAPYHKMRCMPVSEDAAAPDPRIAEARAAIRATRRVSPRVGVVLGSGLGAFTDSIDDRSTIPCSAVPHLPIPKVAGHSGRLCFGRIDDMEVACLEGRVHLYEGHPVSDVVFGCRFLAALGCQVVLLTNAAGGIREGLAPGSLMLIADHLNLTGHNPLVGAEGAFIDMTSAYDATLRELAHRAAGAAGVPLHEGVYAGLLGPTYETPAEIRMLRSIGADAVGMSTVLETIALRHAGVRVGALSNITNYAAGLSSDKLDHGDVRETARRSRDAFVSLLTGWVRLLSGAVDRED